MNSYTSKIDLTSKAQKQERSELSDSLREPDPALPEVTIDDLPADIIDAVRAMGWKNLMPVQAKAIPYILSGRDIIVQSRTGSGKTGAFLLPLLKLVNSELRETQALILTPTRELARQVENEFVQMVKGAGLESMINVGLVYGGVSYKPQIQSLRQGAQVVIGTPGRILDHLEKKTFGLGSIQIFILDEADEMLSMGFYPAMKALRRYLPRERNSYMFSATIPVTVQRLAEEFLHAPGFLSLSEGQIHVDAMDHRYFLVKDPMDKDRVLAALLEIENPDSAIIFANTKRDVEYLTQFLKNYGFNVDEISGDLTQKSREAVMDRIRRAKLRLLVATDVAARGIDISDLSHVFLYDVPQDPEYYIHRAGRTARAGKTGVAISIATHMDEKNLQAIGRKYDIELEKKPMPSEEDVQQKVAERLIVVLEDRLRTKTNIERERMQRFLPLISQLIDDGEPELLAMLLDEVFQKILRQPPEAPTTEEPASPPERIPRRPSSKGSRRNPR